MDNKVLTAQQVRISKRNNIVKGTIILTLAGFATRFIGFFYRIFLSNSMGAELCFCFSPGKTLHLCKCYSLACQNIDKSREIIFPWMSRLHLMNQ
jgi:hypothetical protein